MGENQQLISLKPGTIISGRYEVVKCLGAGSMGLVYACRHIELAGQLVAVKVLFPEVAQDKVAAARFKNEIQAAYGVSHPNVVRAYEFIRDGKMLAYTMEYVGGGDVAEKLSDPSQLMDIREILSIAIQMCLGVQAIHDAGIVHRDLKPENILLTKDGQVKIADFGIAKAGNGPRLTEHGGVVGTIDYVSPEYMLNAQVDWRADIYAMGVLLYEMLTGSSPFKADSVYATMTKRLKTDPAPPSKLREDCPAHFDNIVKRAMQRDPELRYQSALEMGQDLIALQGSLGLDGRSSGAAARSAAPVKSQIAAVESTAQTKPQQSSVKSTDAESYSRQKSNAGYVRERESKEFSADRKSSSNLQKSSLLNPSDSEQTVLLDISSQQMESVLSGKVSVFDSWDTPSRERENSLKPSAGFGSGKALNGQSRSLWPAFLTFIFAIIVGISVGLGVLWIYAPHVLDRWQILSYINNIYNLQLEPAIDAGQEDTASSEVGSDGRASGGGSKEKK